MLRTVYSASLAHLRRLWREEDGFLVSTEWLFWATIVGIGTIAAVMALRYAAREVFVNIGVEIAKEQSYEFHKHGHRDFEGYQVMTSPHHAAPAFEKLGAVPGPSWENGGVGENPK